MCVRPTVKHFWPRAATSTVLLTLPQLLQRQILPCTPCRPWIILPRSTSISIKRRMASCGSQREKEQKAFSVDPHPAYRAQRSHKETTFYISWLRRKTQTFPDHPQTHLRAKNCYLRSIKDFYCVLFKTALLPPVSSIPCTLTFLPPRWDTRTRQALPWHFPSSTGESYYTPEALRQLSTLQHSLTAHTRADSCSYLIQSHIWQIWSNIIALTVLLRDGIRCLIAVKCKQLLKWHFTVLSKRKTKLHQEWNNCRVQQQLQPTHLQRQSKQLCSSGGSECLG